MTKYDEDFKRRVVDAYLAGEGGYLLLAKRFGVKSKVNISNWVKAFKEFGEQGLLLKKTHATYPVQFKLDVLNYKLRTGDSSQEVALKFGINNPPMISSWLSKWQIEGIEGLSKEKGRPPLVNKPKDNDTLKELTREQQLEKEVELLKVENAYLKKLRASGINIPNRLLKQNQESSVNSEKGSD